jgi:hypothetical protein
MLLEQPCAPLVNQREFLVSSAAIWAEALWCRFTTTKARPHPLSKPNESRCYHEIYLQEAQLLTLAFLICFWVVLRARVEVL